MHEAPIPFVQLKREGTHNPWGLWPVPIASSSSQRSIRKRCAIARGWFFCINKNVSKKETWNMNFQWSLQLIDCIILQPFNDRNLRPISAVRSWGKSLFHLWVIFSCRRQKSSLDPCRQCERCCLKGLRILQQYDLWWGIRRQWNTGCVIEVHFQFQQKQLERLFQDLFCFVVVGPLFWATHWTQCGISTDGPCDTYTHHHPEKMYKNDGKRDGKHFPM